jgi:hypothetical protein
MALRNYSVQSRGAKKKKKKGSCKPGTSCSDTIRVRHLSPSRMVGMIRSECSRYFSKGAEFQNQLVTMSLHYQLHKEFQIQAVCNA